MEIEDQPTISLTEFAYAIGKSERTVRRYQALGKLPVIETEFGARVLVTEVANWKKKPEPVRPELLTLIGEFQTPGSDFVPDTNQRIDQAILSFAGHPPAVPVIGQTLHQRMPENAGQVPAVPDTDQPFYQEMPVTAGQIPAMPVDIHRIALEHAANLLVELKQAQNEAKEARESQERAERRTEQLLGELGGYRRMLAESAESLVEQRAAAITAEAQRQVMAEQLNQLAQAAKELDYQGEPKIETTRPAARGWGSRFRAILFRKIG